MESLPTQTEQNTENVSIAKLITEVVEIDDEKNDETMEWWINHPHCA